MTSARIVVAASRPAKKPSSTSVSELSRSVRLFERRTKTEKTAAARTEDELTSSSASCVCSLLVVSSSYSWCRGALFCVLLGAAAGAAATVALWRAYSFQCPE